MKEYRRHKSGRLLSWCLACGFVAAGLRRAFLEVTARNDPAVRMYRQLGFRSYKTIYRSVSLPDPEPAPIVVDPAPVGLGL